ncbi:MAG: Rrf2 family transcriptional regulator [Candidatus Zixiibacteriota bacterium]|nr:MAG: Rrf2 family transcriptional regulator [candidate division Zixibacteria bacterium]
MISLKAQYGLKAIVSLAMHQGKGPLQAKEIASSQTIPVRYLELLLSQLRRARLVNATRGKNGGYILVKDPAKVTVWDIVATFEGKVIFSQPPEMKRGVAGKDEISFVWSEAEKRVVDYLQSVKVSDLLEAAQSGKQMYFI